MIFLVPLISLIFIFGISLGRFPLKYDRFCAVYVPNYEKISYRRQGQSTEVEDSKICPFAEHTMVIYMMYWPICLVFIKAFQHMIIMAHL